MRLSTVLLVLAAAGPVAAAPFELKDGDKVVFLGSTLVEREQRYGYWETALTARWPERKFTFRNLGWSGDNVAGEARLAFDLSKPELGLKRIVDLTLAEKPTVIFICYGLNESSEGRAGLQKFEEGLGKLIDAMAPAKATIVLFSPTPFERSGPAQDTADAHNTNLAWYRDVIARVAKSRSLTFADLFGAFGEGRSSAGPFTDNGLHLTGFGFWATRIEFERALGLPALGVRSIQDGDSKLMTQNAKAEIVAGEEFRLNVELATLPEPPMPRDGAILDFKRPIEMSLRIKGLSNGERALKIDGKEVARASSQRWAEGVSIASGPDFEQAEQLRQAIVAKNKLYFYRWRPQNETYLFGFRKHEQGKNGKEVAEFDPLIAKAEDQINQLKKPKTHRYELTPVTTK